MRGIVAPASRDIDVQDREVRARLHAARPAWAMRRILVVVLLALPLLTYLATGRLLATLVVPAVLFLLLTEAEIQVTLRLGNARHMDLLTVGFRALYALLVVFSVEAAAIWPWIVPTVLLLMIFNSSTILPAWGLAAVTAIAGVANTAAAWLASSGLVAFETITGATVARPASVEVLAVSFVVFPVLALFLHLRTRHMAGMQQRLEGTIDALRETQEELQQSQEQLRRWNEQLHEDVRRQTDELEERNRSLSILNTISFALAEPMDDQGGLERATRLVARLLGVRAAQACHSVAQGEDGHLFVTVAPDDVHAPRLPEVLLHAVMGTGRPLSSEEAAPEPGLETPDLGEPYAVVPLVAKGRVLGALGLIGAGSFRWDDDGRHLLLLVGREMGVALENARLYGDAVEEAAREALLSEVSRFLNSDDRGDRTISYALDCVTKHFGARETMLITAAEQGRAARVRGHTTSGGAPSWLLPLAPSAPGLVADRFTPLILGSGGEAPLSAPLASAGAGTLAIAPVVATRGRPVGRLEAASTTPALAGVLALVLDAGSTWDAASTDLLHRISDLVARRIEADELVAVQQQRIHELTGLAEIARSIQSTTDTERLFTGFAAALARLIPYQRAYIVQMDEFGDLQRMPVFGPQGRLLRVADDIAEDRTHPWCSLRSATRWRPGDEAPPALFDDGLAAAMVVPMRPKGQMLGFVAIGLDRPAGDDQFHIAEQAVEQLALALDGTLLYQQATARASHIQALSNLARIVASVVDLREAFAAFSEEMRWLIPFDRAVMLLLDEHEVTVQPYATYPDAHSVVEPASLGRSIVSAPVHAGAPIAIRRDDPRFAGLDWGVLGPDVQEVAAVPVKQGARTAAVFALVQSADTPVDGDGYAFADLDALGEVGGLLGVTIERLRLYEQAEHGANHDLLTGLPNYRYLQRRFRSLHAGLDQPGESAVLVVDMDNLKFFNDSLGHETGDSVIRIVARQLQAACRAEDFVARTGGDEFVVVMEGADAEAAMAVAERVHSGLADAHQELPGVTVRISVSIGIASAPADTTVATDLIPLADQAMYEAKFAGGHRTRLARPRADEGAPGLLRARGRRLAESLVRALLAGSTATESAATSLVQRWAVAVAADLDGLSHLLPQLRMLVAYEIAQRLDSPRDDEDAALARSFVGGLRRERVETDEAARMVVESLIPMLVGLAWRSGGRPSTAETSLAAASDDDRQHPLWPVVERAIRATETERRVAGVAA